MNTVPEVLMQGAFVSFAKFALTSPSNAAHKIREQMNEAGLLDLSKETTREEVRRCLVWLAENCWGEPVDIEAMLEPEAEIAE